MLKDRYGNPLSVWVSGNGDGYIATLGYFNQANDSTLENHFLGSWIPLTEGTRIGDSVPDMDSPTECFPLQRFSQIE